MVLAITLSPSQMGFDAPAYENALAAAGIGLWEHDFKSDHVRICGNAAHMLGMPQRYIDFLPSEWRDKIVADDLGQVEQTIKHAYTKGGAFIVEFRVKCEDKGILWLQLRGDVVEDSNGHLDHASGVVSNITDKKKAEEALRISNERLKLAVEGSGDGIWDLDLIADTYKLSGGMREILGYSDGEAERHASEWRRIIHPDDLARNLSTLGAYLNGDIPKYQCEYRIRAGDGSWKWILSRGAIVLRDEHGKPVCMTGIITDITIKKESDQIVWRHANLDSLTGLPNRRFLLNELESELREAPRIQSITALLFIDLDGFKQINDLFGHEIGDAVLMETANRIQRSIRSTDKLARLGGDEFVVLLRNLHTPDHIEFVCQSILSHLASRFKVNCEYAYISGSIGVAISSMDAQTAEELLRKADTAMYAAKSAGKNQFSYFSQSMDEKAHMQLRLAAELRQALSLHQLSLYYQPVIDLHTGRAVKMEALLRWDHPKLGKVDPSVFIPLAESAGLMSEIGNWVFHEATGSMKEWINLVGETFQISINKSPAQSNRRYIESNWLRQLKELNLPPSTIVVEIREGLLLNASSQVNEKLIEYRDAGIQVAIDDFGTGYSSMAYLQKFDIDYLKIDQSFIHGIPKNTDNCTIAETIIVMAHKLGQKVIAEGIETKEQADFLIDAGCDFGQGFYFSTPEPAERVATLLNQRYL